LVKPIVNKVFKTLPFSAKDAKELDERKILDIQTTKTNSKSRI